MANHGADTAAPNSPDQEDATKAFSDLRWTTEENSRTNHPFSPSSSSSSSSSLASSSFSTVLVDLTTPTNRRGKTQVAKIIEEESRLGQDCFPFLHINKHNKPTSSWSASANKDSEVQDDAILSKVGSQLGRSRFSMTDSPRPSGNYSEESCLTCFLFKLVFNSLLKSRSDLYSLLGDLSKRKDEQELLSMIWRHLFKPLLSIQAIAATHAI